MLRQNGAMKYAPLLIAILLGCDPSPDDVTVGDPNKPGEAAVAIHATWLDRTSTVVGLKMGESQSVGVLGREVMIHFENRNVAVKTVSATFYQKKGVLTKVVLRAKDEEAPEFVQRLGSATSVEADFVKNVAVRIEREGPGQVVITLESTLPEYR